MTTLQRGSLVRATAKDINRAVTQSSAVSRAGFFKEIPFILGEDRTPGIWLVRPYVVDVAGTDHCRFAILWSDGGDYGIEGVQAVYINGQAVSASYMTHYAGTSGQAADPTLSADLPGFADTYDRLAYTVFDIPAGTFTGFPATRQIEAVVRGIKVSPGVWTENPGKLLAEWLRSTRFGPGLTVTGDTAVADRCDELVGGVEVRCKIGQTFQEPLLLEDGLALLSTYAECLASYDGTGVLLVPDAPVETPDSVLTVSDIEDGTLYPKGISMRSAPTEVTVAYRESSGSAEQWPESSRTVALAGVETGDVESIPSELNLPGIRRPSEAERKALMRLRRLQHVGRIPWVAFDDGVKFQLGDMVQLPSALGMTDRLVRIMSIDMTEPGRYSIEAEPYDPGMYPDDYTPSTTTTVPVGGILTYTGSGTPAGYSDFTAANDRFLVGAGLSFTRSDLFGSTSFAISGTTSAVPDHSTGAGTFTAIGDGVYDGNGSPRNKTDPGGAHAHNYSAAQDAEPPFAKTRLIVKTGTPGDVPAAGGVWADGDLISTAYSALGAHLGRLAAAGSTATAGGGQFEYSAYIVTDEAGAHDHTSGSPAWGTLFAEFPETYYPPLSVRGHKHSGHIPVALSIPRVKLAHFVTGSGFQIVPGAIIGFDGDGSLPPGWYDADGANGTVDTRDYWIERAAVGDAGTVVAGTRQAVWDGETYSGGAHEHKGSPRGADDYIEHEQAAHETGESHRHDVSGAVPYDPPSYAMRFIQYTGVV